MWASLASPRLSCVWPAAKPGFQLQLLFPERRLPDPPRAILQGLGGSSGEAHREDDNFQPTQLELDLQCPEFGETLQVSWSGNINLHSFFF